VIIESIALSDFGLLIVDNCFKTMVEGGNDQVRYALFIISFCPIRKLAAILNVKKL